MKLTDVAIRKAQPKTKAYKLVDGQGLFLLITPSGGKLWRWKYRFDGKEKLMALGQYPETSLAEARDKHQAARKLRHSSIDPMEDRKSARSAAENALLNEQRKTENTFANVANKWHQHWTRSVTERHARSRRNRMEMHIFPIIGNRPITSIEPLDVVQVVKKVDEENNATVMAQSVHQIISQVFRYAIAHSYTKRNPATDFKLSDILKSHKRVNFARVDQKTFNNY